jgi:hypothetical protein
MPAREGFRNKGASKNWEKWISCAWAVGWTTNMADRREEAIYMICFFKIIVLM